MSDRFFILAVTGDQHEFVEVAGEAVDIGFDIPAFAYNSDGNGNPLEYWNIFDLVSGWRLGRAYGTKAEALRVVSGTVAHKGKDEYMRQQALKMERYGKSPAVTS